MRKIGFYVLIWVAWTLQANAQAVETLPAVDRVDDRGMADQIRGVSMSNTTAVTVGFSATAGGGQDFVIRAINAASGAVKWEDQQPAATSVITDVFSAAEGTLAFVAGYTPGATASQSDILVKAYNANTGEIAWTHSWDAGRDDLPKGLCAIGGRVTVVGYGGNFATGESVHGLVRTFDATTGEVLWTSIINTSVGGNAVWGVACDGTRVIAAGTETISLRKHLLVRSYDAATGALNWSVNRASTSPVGATIHNGIVMVAGASGSSAFLAGYDVNTGAPSWLLPASPGNFTTLDADSGIVVAAGRSGTSAYAVAADVATGQVAWTQKPAVPARATEAIKRVLVSGKAVYMTGAANQTQFTTNPSPMTSEWLLRVYDLSGNLTHEERSNQGNGNGNVVQDAVLLGEKLVMAGNVMGATQDAATKAVDVSSIEKAGAVTP